MEAIVLLLGGKFTGSSAVLPRWVVVDLTFVNRLSQAVRGLPSLNVGNFHLKDAPANNEVNLNLFITGYPSLTFAYASTNSAVPIAS